MPRPVVPNVASVASKWARRAAGAMGDYQSGVDSTSADWAALAAAAKDVWKNAVTAAAGRGAYEKGIGRRGTAGWKAKTSAKGPARYAEGVGQAEPDYSGQVAPYLQLIAATDLPPRQQAGSPANIGRVSAIATALRALKERR